MPGEPDRSSTTTSEGVYNLPARLQRPVRPIAAQLLTDRPSALPPSPIHDPASANGRGVAYERFVQGFLCDIYGLNYLPGPWVMYCEADRKVKYAQPDGLLIEPYAGIIVVVEIKLNHVDRAYFQLEHLYRPLVAKLFPYGWTIITCEVCEWFDQAVRLPGAHVKRRYHITQARPGAFNVMVLHRQQHKRHGISRELLPLPELIRQLQAEEQTK